MYTVFGYTDDLINFEFSVAGFVAAVTLYKMLNKYCVVFMNREGQAGTCNYVRNYA